MRLIRAESVRITRSASDKSGRCLVRGENVKITPSASHKGGNDLHDA